MSNHLLRRQADLAALPAHPKYRAMITIGLLPSGQVEVKGPMHLKDLCEQMLHEAFGVLVKFHADKEEESSIFTPEPTKIILRN